MKPPVHAYTVTPEIFRACKAATQTVMTDLQQRGMDPNAMMVVAAMLAVGHATVALREVGVELTPPMLHDVAGTMVPLMILVLEAYTESKAAKA